VDDEVGPALEDVEVAPREQLVRLDVVAPRELVPDLQVRVALLDVVRLVEDELVRLVEPIEAEEPADQGDEQRARPPPELVGRPRTAKPRSQVERRHRRARRPGHRYAAAGRQGGRAGVGHRAMVGSVPSRDRERIRM
jgi:hypothetical protein